LLPIYSGKRYSRFIWCEVIEFVGLVLCGRIGFDWLVWKKILDRVGLYVGFKRLKVQLVWSRTRAAWLIRGPGEGLPRNGRL
jgi:hypothetical protein